jgi:hypothetical protein
MQVMHEIGIGFAWLLSLLCLTIVPVLYREGQTEGEEEKKEVDMYPKCQQGNQFVANYSQNERNATVLQKMLNLLLACPARRPHFPVPGVN